MLRFINEARGIPVRGDQILLQLEILLATDQGSPQKYKEKLYSHKI